MEQDVQRESPIPWQRVKRRRTNTGENSTRICRNTEKNRFAVFENIDQNENTSSGKESANKKLWEFQLLIYHDIIYHDIRSA